MGKGDKKSKRGKIVIGTYGVRRRKKGKTYKPAAPVQETKAAKPKPVKVINETELEEAPVVQSNTPAENGEVNTEKKPKKAAAKKTGEETKPKASKPKKGESPEEEQQQLF